MKRGFKVMAVMAGLLMAPAGSSGLFAVCQEDGVFPMFQCGFLGWFAPPPAEAGSINAIWWQVGYGNNLLNNGIIGLAATDGTGTVGATFPGNDSGVALPPPPKTNTGPLGLTDANQVLGTLFPPGAVPAGALCADYENSWGAFGVDGCPDNRRTSAGEDNDNLLNPYWGTLGPCPFPVGDDCSAYYQTYYQVDYPIAFLARTSSNKWFALAFMASNSRNLDPRDASEGVFNAGAFVNGDPNPVPANGNNIIPWQQVPTPHVTNITPIPFPPGEPVNVSLQWDNIRIIHDGSTRPTGARAAAAVVAGGVGVLDHLDEVGGLCRFQLQTAPAGVHSHPDPSTLSWVNVAGAPACGGTGLVTANLTVNPGTAVRVRTILGKQARTTSTAVANARLGASGDLGFEATDCRADNCVNSPPLIVVLSSFASETIVDAAAVREKGGIRLTFRTTAELSVDGIDVLGRGNAVIASIACTQCTTGVGDSYDVLLERGALKGAKSITLRLNGPGGLTDPIPVP